LKRGEGNKKSSFSAYADFARHSNKGNY
jgi:hypothetical protein